MNKQLDLPKFKEIYCTTILKDELSDHKYIKLFVDDYSDIGYLQGGLLDAIEIMCRSVEYDKNNSETLNSIGILSKILKSLTPHAEFEGISEISN